MVYDAWLCLPDGAICCRTDRSDRTVTYRHHRATQGYDQFDPVNGVMVGVSRRGRRITEAEAKRMAGQASA
jgi:hypothetical protein